MHIQMFNKYRVSPILIIGLTFAAYLACFNAYHDRVGDAMGSLALIPTLIASWYFGTRGGIILVLISILANSSILILKDHSPLLLVISPSNLIGMFTLFLAAIVTGRFSVLLQERRNAIHKLEQYERDRASHTKFLEHLNQITARALESDSLKSTLEVLTEQMAHLFHADDAFFSLWDEAREVPIPVIAYGSMKDVYPFVQFESGEITLSTSVMQCQCPLFVPDVENSPHISPNVAALFPSRSMLGIPLITQQHKLGAILLGYNNRHHMADGDIVDVDIVAEQVALVLSKSQLLEEERRQVRQLTALHDVALISIEADDEDQLIERVTDLIGKNLYPDNFGVLIFHEQLGMLCPHPSYRFYMADDLKVQNVALGSGITGHVAESGQPWRVGNVRRIPTYIDVDDRTISELCVPIKFKERILGVINAESTKRDAFTADDERMLVTLAGQLATAIEQLRKAQAERIILDQLAHDRDLIYSIAQITAHIERSLNADQIVQTMGSELEKIGLTCMMAVYDQDQKSFKINYTSMRPRLLGIVEDALGYPLVNYCFPRHHLNPFLKDDDLHRPAVLSDPAEEIRVLFNQINRTSVSAILERIGIVNGIEPLRLPLVFEENLLGILWVWGKGVTRSDLPILSIFSKQIGVTLERSRLFQEVQSLALTDPLTGLQNRRSLFELGRIEFSRSQRMGRPFSCMMLDVDHFKEINDNHGHQIGDQVLQEFGKRYKAYVREIDLVGRYGGEEFMILLPETDRDRALMAAERIRNAVAQNPISTTAGPLDLTISIGVATMDDKTTHLDALVARADQALYIAKHKGRNRVSISI